MRALKVAVVVMGVMIVLGMVGLAVGVVLKLRARPAAQAAAPAAVPTGGAVPRAVLDEPAGTRIAAVLSAGGRLVLELQGGGPDRLVLLDPASGAVTARVSLAR